MSDTVGQQQEAPARSRRTQAERTAATRGALVEAGRTLFSTKGFAEVGTDELARAAGVSRGALYHQYGGKLGLFEAVLEQVEHDLVAVVAQALDSVADPWGALTTGVDAWLAASADPVEHRIALVEAPAALGWARWREIGHQHVFGLVEATLQGLVDSGAARPVPVAALAHVLVGALGEGSLYVAAADDADTARAEVREAVLALARGVLAPA